jgi:hypothetical protein
MALAGVEFDRGLAGSGPKERETEKVADGSRELFPYDVLSSFSSIHE